MTSNQYENLVKIGQIKEERGDQEEFGGLVNSAERRLRDALNTSLAYESRFDLAYNASHALALAALRWHGYRSENRYIVFQCLGQTLGMEPKHWRVLANCHQRRNVAEYEGHFEIDEQLLEDLLRVTEMLLEQVKGMGEIR